jgi:hypothetical protein
LDRASGYEPEGREFESLRAHHSFQAVTADSPTSSLGNFRKLVSTPGYGWRVIKLVYTP